MTTNEGANIPAHGATADRWPVERRWTVLSDAERLERVRTSDLERYRACAILGAAGLGKTYELRELAEIDRRHGREVWTERLALIGSTAEGLESRLHFLSTSTSAGSAIYLDALDEVMVPVATAGLIIERWIRNELANRLPVIRLSCRSAVWPQNVEVALREVYGTEEFATAVLQPLEREEIGEIVTIRGFSPDAFYEAVEQARADALAQQPLTFEMLLRVFDQGRALPGSRRELFEKGVKELASEQMERLEGGTAGEFTIEVILEAAERLACFSLLSGRETIDLGNRVESSSLGRIELESLISSDRALDYELLRAVGRCGLCESDASRQFRFAHRQFAEYLAGRRLATLLPHQSKEIFSSSSEREAGIATPLRETAAFAAIHSEEIATWLAQFDPEVVGLSDVADDQIRRRSTLNLLERFRRHELTDAQLIRGGIVLAGFQYPGAEADLTPVLRERQAGCDDVLECAVALIKQWQLASMSNKVADLMLDATAPLEARRSAGYALASMGTPEACRRLQPLLSEHLEDPELDLKGLALQCITKLEISTSELLAAIATRIRPDYGGAYHFYLLELERSGFDASDARVEGLRWAARFQYRDCHHEPHGRIASRIAIAAIDELEEPGVAEALADLLLTAAKNHSDSPLVLPRRISEENNELITPRLEAKPAARRKLIESIVSHAVDDSTLRWIASETPGLAVSEDFPWLLERATSGDLLMSLRKRFAAFAATLRWCDRAENIDAWLAVRTVEPVASCFPFPLYIDLDSEEAVRVKREHQKRKIRNRSCQPDAISPTPSEQVEQLLMLCETRNTSFFVDLARVLTLEENSTCHRFLRFLTDTPGWGNADAKTCQRIVKAAKRFLIAETDKTEQFRNAPWNTIAVTHMAAIWLVMEKDLSWLKSLPADWWNSWCWYILRESHPGLSDEHERQELKVALLKLLHDRAPSAVRIALVKWACSPASDASNRLPSLLEIFSPIEDSELSIDLCERLSRGEIAGDVSGDVARFVLSRNAAAGISSLASCLTRLAGKQDDDLVIGVCIAMMEKQPAACWPNVYQFLLQRHDLASRVLAGFADRESIARHSTETWRWRCEDTGQLVGLLLEAFSPESDPQSGRAFFMTGDDSARRLCNQLINWLSEQPDVKAVNALRSLEQRFGATRQWLRRPRASAEQAFLRSCWRPIPPPTVSIVLSEQSKRLIRSEQGAMEGVVEAIIAYVDQLRHGNPNDIEDFWDCPRGAPASPKNEERVSDKICSAIRKYFQDYAVTADREVQVSRRILSRVEGGAPGSEVDVICRIPALGSTHMSPITVPVEVKWCHNQEAKTGLSDQLVDRYVDQTGAGCGVFVVAWTGMPPASPSHRPVWSSVSQAKEFLSCQAAKVSAATGLKIRAVVIDLSLPKVASGGDGK